MIKSIIDYEQKFSAPQQLTQQGSIFINMQSFYIQSFKHLFSVFMTLLNKNMFKYFVSSQYRKVYHQLQALGILSPSKNTTKYSQMSVPFIGQPNITNFLEEAINIMMNEKITSQKSLKFISFIHVALQLVKDIQNFDSIMKLLSYLLKICEEIIGKQTIKPSASLTARNSVALRTIQEPTTMRSSRNSAVDRISKQLYLNINIIKPYIAYLYKVIAIFDFYHECKSKKDISINESWMIINVLKLIEAVVKNFQNVGRYYQKDYEDLIVLLSQIFSRDILRFYPKINGILTGSVAKIQERFAQLNQQYGPIQVYDHLDIENIDDCVQIVEELAYLNENLFQFYMNKYCYSKIQHIQAPNWIQTTCNQFDFMFHISKIKNRIDKQKKKRGLKKTDSLISLLNNGENIKFDFSVSFIQPQDNPFRKKDKKIV